MDHTSQSSSSSSLSSTFSSTRYADIESALMLPRQPIHYAAKKKKPASTCTSALAVTSLVLSVVCLLGMGALCCWFFIINGGKLDIFAEKFLQPNEEVCLPCIQVNPNPFDDTPSVDIQKLDIRYDSENDTEICCALTSAQYAALFKLILQRQEEVKNLAEVLGSSEPQARAGVPGDQTLPGVSAHLVYKPKTKGATDGAMQHWKTPAESADRSHVHGGLKFHDNRIYVQSAGLYFVYCQILYGDVGGEPSSTKNYDPSIISNYVKRFSVVRPGISGILLKSRHTRYSENKDRQSNYVGGLFRLYQGDQLYVEVSEPKYVSHDDTASFFGLFKVSD